MFSSAFVKNARTILEDLKPGEALSLPWMDVVDKENILATMVNKVFILADDKKVKFEYAFLHVPRVPDIDNIIGLDLPYSVLHFRYLHSERVEYKRIWCMISEFSNKERGAFRVNLRYYEPKKNCLYFDLEAFTSLS